MPHLFETVLLFQVFSGSGKSISEETVAEAPAEQLDGWPRDPATWPNDRSFDVFGRWFDYHHHSALIDLCDELLITESD